MAAKQNTLSTSPQSGESSDRPYGPVLRNTCSLVFQNYLDGCLGLGKLKPKKHEVNNVVVTKVFESDEDEDEENEDEEITKAVEVAADMFIKKNRFVAQKGVKETRKVLGSSLERVRSMMCRNSGFKVENLRQPRRTKKIYENYAMACEVQKSTPISETKTSGEAQTNEILQESSKPLENLSGNVETTAIDAKDNAAEYCSDTGVENVQPPKRRHRTRKTSQNAQTKALHQKKSTPLEILFGNVETAAIDVMDNALDTDIEDVKPRKRRRRVSRQGKIFKCSVCSKEYKFNWMLVSHQRVHTGKKPFQCKVCKAQFADSSNLTAHMRVLNHHSWKYKCEVCEKPFSKMNYLRRHNSAACAKYLKKYSKTEREGHSEN